MGLDMKDFNKFKDQFRELSKDFNNFLKGWTIKEGYKVVADAKLNTPPFFSKRPEDSKSTGNFRNSFYAEHYRKKGNKASIRVGNSVEYASHLEYGHVIKGGEGRQEIVGFKEGAYVLTKSINKIESGIADDFDADFSAFLKQKGIS